MKSCATDENDWNAVCDQMKIPRLSDSGPLTGSVPMKIAEELCLWVEASLDCEDWIWDGQQKEAAEFAVRQFQQFKEQNATGEPSRKKV